MARMKKVSDCVTWNQVWTGVRRLLIVMLAIAALGAAYNVGNRNGRVEASDGFALQTQLYNGEVRALKEKLCSSGVKDYCSFQMFYGNSFIFSSSAQ